MLPLLRTEGCKEQDKKNAPSLGEARIEVCARGPIDHDGILSS